MIDLRCARKKEKAKEKKRKKERQREKMCMRVVQEIYVNNYIGRSGKKTC